MSAYLLPAVAVLEDVRCTKQRHYQKHPFLKLDHMWDFFLPSLTNLARSRQHQCRYFSGGSATEPGPVQTVMTQAAMAD